MPIYEFKCLKCEKFFELLLLNTDEQVEMKCPHCGSGDFERVLSSTHYAMGGGGGGQTGSSVKTRTCSSGSCTTYEVPGPTG